MIRVKIEKLDEEYTEKIRRLNLQETEYRRKQKAEEVKEWVTIGAEVSLCSPYDWSVGLKSIWDAAVVFFVDGYGDRSHRFSMLSLLLPVDRGLIFVAAVNLLQDVKFFDFTCCVVACELRAGLIWICFLSQSYDIYICLIYTYILHYSS
ncbi:hypothetical protein L6452_28900 [Arctium lappa]|uniref:Uncharacterized protein n=1 Tax=Arctium lappa TaxID=4217 RepID=A0ACB8ZZK4_ARCLA|nr:hypothetical protein L6452_28900 [Arctium lappa]